MAHVGWHGDRWSEGPALGAARLTCLGLAGAGRMDCRSHSIRSTHSSPGGRHEVHRGNEALRIERLHRPIGVEHTDGHDASTSRERSTIQVWRGPEVQQHSLRTSSWRWSLISAGTYGGLRRFDVATLRGHEKAGCSALQERERHQPNARRLGAGDTTVWPNWPPCVDCRAVTHPAFKNRSGLPPPPLVIDARVKKAKALLRGRRCRLPTFAVACGFALTRSHLTRVLSCWRGGGTLQKWPDVWGRLT